MKFSKVKALATTGATAIYLGLMNAQVVLAADVLVGICVALFIIIKRMPDADDPREKSEVYHAVGRVAGLVALAAAIIWILPWVYSLFT